MARKLKLKVRIRPVFSLDDRISSVMNAIHMEPKQIILGLCLGDEELIASHLRSSFMEYISGVSHLLPSTQNFSRYLQSFLENGLACMRRFAHREREYRIVPPEEANKDKDIKVWRLTAPGQIHGKPVSLFTLCHSVEHNRSMYSILGNTKHATLQLPYDIRGPPYYRARILQLIDKGVTTNSELASKLVQMRYRKDTRADLPSIVSETGELKGPLKYYLKNLERIGFIADGNNLSLTEEGKAFVRDYLTPIENALQNKESLQDMRDLLDRFHRDKNWAKETCTAAMEIYQSTSPMRHTQPKEYREQQILGFVQDYEGESGHGPQYTEICEHVGVSVRTYLRDLVEQERLAKHRDGRLVRYYLPPERSF
jgi:hypothetical protein